MTIARFYKLCGCQPVLWCVLYCIFTNTNVSNVAGFKPHLVHLSGCIYPLDKSCSWARGVSRTPRCTCTLTRCRYPPASASARCTECMRHFRTLFYICRQRRRCIADHQARCTPRCTYSLPRCRCPAVSASARCTECMRHFRTLFCICRRRRRCIAGHQHLCTPRCTDRTLLYCLVVTANLQDIQHTCHRSCIGLQGMECTK